MTTASNSTRQSGIHSVTGASIPLDWLMTLSYSTRTRRDAVLACANSSISRTVFLGIQRVDEW